LNRIKENLSDLTPETGGIKVNDKGYLVLPDCLGIIYGDSVTVEDVRESLDLVTDETNHFSSQNIVFGVGGNLLQNGITRGWLDFAEKTCVQYYQNVETGVIQSHAVGKDAVGKVSLKGAQKVVKVDDTFKVVLESDPEFKDCPSTMVVMYEDGKLYNFDSLDTIRARVASYTKFTFE
jgi:nicotinamide phosphoribosyltransferase